MDNQQQFGPTTPTAAVRTLQIIVIALVIGPAIFLGCVLFNTQMALTGDLDLICYIGFGAVLWGFVMYLVLPNMLVKGMAGVTKSELEGLNAEEKFLRLFPQRQTATIIRCAVIEGTAMLNIIAYMQTASVYSFVTSVVLILLILPHMPTQSSAEFWVEDRAREIESKF